MTPERLAEIRAREQAATAGPWFRDFDNAERPVIYVPLEVKDCVSVLFEADWGKEADADFAAHARTDIPDLLAEVERLTTEHARLREALGCYAAEANWEVKPPPKPGLHERYEWQGAVDISDDDLNAGLLFKRGRWQSHGAWIARKVLTETTPNPIGSGLASTPPETCPQPDQPS